MSEKRHDSSHKDLSSLGDAEKKQKVFELARYFLCQDKRKVPIKRQDITKSVLKEHVKSFQPIFEDTQKFLSHVFGINVTECEVSSKAKVYLLTNTLEIGDELVRKENGKNFGLLMIILSLVYMSSGVLNDDQLKRALKQLGVPKDSSHSQLGDVSKHLQNFIKQGYIVRERIVQGDASTHQYKLGLRSQTETSKRRILEFISEMYNVDVCQWKLQYKEILAEEMGSNS